MNELQGAVLGICWTMGQMMPVGLAVSHDGGPGHQYRSHTMGTAKDAALVLTHTSSCIKSRQLDSSLGT